MPQGYISNAFLTAFYSPDYTFDWENMDVRALLLDDSQETDRSHTYVDALSGELDDDSYSRQELSGLSANLHDDADPPRLVLTSDDVVFEDLHGDDDPDRMVLYVHENDDEDSWILGYFYIRRGGETITPTGDDLIIPPHEDYGWFSLRQKSPED